MKNPVREKLSQGKVSIGSWLNLGSPLAGEVMADAGFEWLTVDAEHTAYDCRSLPILFTASMRAERCPLSAPGITIP